MRIKNDSKEYIRNNNFREVDPGRVGQDHFLMLVYPHIRPHPLLARSILSSKGGSPVNDTYAPLEPTLSARNAEQGEWGEESVDAKLRKGF